MAVLKNYINIRIRGLIAGQQWQSSWNLGVPPQAEVGDNWVFDDEYLDSWFNVYWNGGGAIPSGGGILDVFRTLAAPNVSILNTRVLARNEITMNSPVQLEYFGNVEGTLSTAANRYNPSFVAASFLARKDDFGGRGAAMRLPFGNEDVAEDQDWSVAFISAMQLFGDYLTSNADAAALQVNSELGSVDVAGIKSVVVKSVAPPLTPSAPKGFPYEFPLEIFASTLTGWTVNPFISTQNSRKQGRGI